MAQVTFDGVHARTIPGMQIEPTAALIQEVVDLAKRHGKPVVLNYADALFVTIGPKTKANKHVGELYKLVHTYSEPGNPLRASFA